MSLRAFCVIKQGPLYRREAFLSGLRNAGLEVQFGPPPQIDRCDVLVIWNRYDVGHNLATQVERRGGRVIVAENGYLGAGGTSPKFDVVDGPKPGDYYALAMSGHNGQGTWPEGGPERFEKLGVELKPWRRDGRHVLVCANRSFGIPGRMMPMLWPSDVAARIRNVTKREVRVRAHPGNDKPQRPLEQDLAGAHAVVIWSSSAGVHALAEGIPVFCEAPYWICKRAAFDDVATIDDADPVDPRIYEGYRRSALERMAWAQWTVEEIASGEPFRRLLWESVTS